MDDPEKGRTSEEYKPNSKEEHDADSPTTSDSRSHIEAETNDVLPTTQQPQSMLVEWEPNDPENPQNFPFKKKITMTFVLSGLNLTVAFSSSVFGATAQQTSERFHVSPEVMILGTSLYLIGFGIGPTMFGPLSELYGRKIPLYIGFFIFAIFQIPVAVATNLQSVLIFRFLQGFFGSAPTAIIGGALADFWNARERGFALPFFAGSLFAGPIAGPIVGAFVTESYLGWRWTQWLTLIMAGFFGTVACTFAPESYAPVLLSRRAKALRHETGNWALHAKHEERKVDLNEIVYKYLTRPARMLILEPILLLFTLYLSFTFGLIYLLFGAYPISFSEVRGMSPGVGSLTFLSILIGVFIGCILLSVTTRTKWAPNYEEGRYQEARLPLMIVGAAALPIGLFWFAWTSFPSISIWPQIIAGVPIGFSVIIITLQGMNYVIDCYTINANSALAAMTFVRSFFGAGFPLFAPAMFHNLGVPWATSTLAFLALAMVPVPVLFWKFGAKIRGMSKYVPT